MKPIKQCLTSLMLLASFILLGCNESPKSPDVADSIRKSLDQSGLKDVSVAQDRDKGVITLSGHVSSDDSKGQAESIAKSLAGNQVVADQIAVLPPGGESDAKTVSSDVDSAIDKNLDAAFIQNSLKKGISYSVKSGVVTLTGDVNSEAKRVQAQKVASAVPNVQQVVNELQVKEQKATSTR